MLQVCYRFNIFSLTNVSYVIFSIFLSVDCSTIVHLRVCACVYIVSMLSYLPLPKVLILLFSIFPVDPFHAVNSIPYHSSCYFLNSGFSRFPFLLLPPGGHHPKIFWVSLSSFIFLFFYVRISMFSHLSVSKFYFPSAFLNADPFHIVNSLLSFKKIIMK